jgi:hypothetical protein
MLPGYIEHFEIIGTALKTPERPQGNDHAGSE